MRVVITGTGAVSPLGITPAALWRGVLDGRAGIQRLDRLSGLEVTTGGEIDWNALADHHSGFRNPGEGGEAGGIAAESGRNFFGALSKEVGHKVCADFGQMIAARAIDDALAEARREPSETGFVWGTALDTYQRGADGLVHRSAGGCFAELAARFAAPRRMLAVACATGTAAIGEAFHLVRSGRAEACVAGGSSVMLGPFYLIGFHALRAVAVDDLSEPAGAACKPFDRRRRGFALSDGAGALVVESLESARRRGVEPIAEVIGYGASQDAFDLNRPPADGAGALLAMQRAIADAALEPAAVHAVNAHGTGTLAGDIAEAAALRGLFGDVWSRVPVSSLKGAIGHTMAAAGALEAIAAVATCRTGIVPPTANLEDPDETCALDHVIGAPRETAATRVISVSFGMGGQNSAIVLSRFAS